MIKIKFMYSLEKAKKKAKPLLKFQHFFEQNGFKIVDKNEELILLFVEGGPNSEQTSMVINTIKSGKLIIFCERHDSTPTHTFSRYEKNATLNPIWEHIKSKNILGMFKN